MISLNATIFVQVGLFLILLLILNRLMIQPIHKLVLEREDHIREKRQEITAIEDEIDGMARDYDERLKQAEQEARGAHQAMRQAVSGEAHQMISNAQEEAAAIRQKVRDDMAKELARAREKVGEQAEILSFEVTERVLGRRV